LTLPKLSVFKRSLLGPFSRKSAFFQSGGFLLQTVAFLAK